MMRENDHTQRMKTQGELIPERKTPISTPSNIPLMAMTPISAATTIPSNPSSAFYKDLTSTLFQQNPSQPSYSMSTSQTMPSLLRPTIFNTTRPTQNVSSSSHTNDLTSSLMNNINSLTSRPQTTPTMNVNTNSSAYFNSGTTSGGSVGLFQPPPPPPSTTIVKSTNVTNSKSAAAELDDLFN